MGLIYSKRTRARKQHTCDYCGFEIEVGQHYNKSFNTDGGDVWTWKNHEDCEQLCRDMGMFKEVPEGVSYDCFWTYVFEYFKDNSGMDIDETPNQEILEWVKSKVTKWIKIRDMAKLTKKQIKEFATHYIGSQMVEIDGGNIGNVPELIHADSSSDIVKEINERGWRILNGRKLILSPDEILAYVKEKY